MLDQIYLAENIDITDLWHNHGTHGRWCSGEILPHLRRSLIRGKCSAKIHIQRTCSGEMFDKR